MKKIKCIHPCYHFTCCKCGKKQAKTIEEFLDKYYPLKKGLVEVE